jgi:hypothetical protein
MVEKLNRQRVLNFRDAFCAGDPACGGLKGAHLSGSLARSVLRQSPTPLVLAAIPIAAPQWH